jgi:protein gp37
VKFLSCEPLIGPLTRMDLTGIDWVIAGGESGHFARPMKPTWARGVRNQCARATSDKWPQGVPFFFKQWGQHDEHGLKMSKAEAGRLLDGQQHDDMPPYPQSFLEATAKQNRGRKPA